jgi:hypothetical protein
MIVRVPDVGRAIIDQLLSLQDNHFRNLLARVDCQVDTAVGTIGLSELVSGAGQVMVMTQTGPPARPEARPAGHRLRRLHLADRKRWRREEDVAGVEPLL